MNVSIYIYTTYSINNSINNLTWLLQEEGFGTIKMCGSDKGQLLTAIIDLSQSSLSSIETLVHSNFSSTSIKQST